MASVRSLPEYRREKDDVERFPILDPFEEECLFAAIRKRSEVAFRLCVFLIDTGCHLSEAFGLTWDDVQDGRAKFPMTQTVAARTLPLTRRASEAVGNPVRRHAGPFVMLSETSFLPIWNEARAEVGLSADDEIVPTALRHTCASRLVQGGIELRRVQLWLGHKSLVETMSYAHFATNDLDPCLALLEEGFDRC